MSGKTHSFNPFDAEQAQNAWPLLAELREEGAVASLEGGMHYVARHAECEAVLRDTTAFSNASGMKEPGVEIPIEDRILGELDPPTHTPVRRVMVTALTPRVVHGAEPFMHATAEELLDAIPVPGEADLVPEFTTQLPNRVTVHLLGFPPEDADQIAVWAKALMESPFPRTNRTEHGEGFANAFPDFAGYIDEHIEQRAGTPGVEEATDVVSRLLTLEVDGDRLTRRQVRALTRNLITGGFTTTSQLLGNLLHQVLSDAEVEAAVRNDPAAADRAIEESLRIAPPVMFVARGCVHDTQIAGDVPVKRGERVIVGTASANRDERLFEDGERYRVDRENADQHLTFGYGPHVCPGAALARVEARIALRTFLERFPPGSIRLAPGFEFVNVPTFFECGPAALPVVTSPA
jgi:cytochrome P450